MLPAQETEIIENAAALCLHSCAYIAWRTKHKLKHWQRWKRFRRCKMSSGCRTRGPNNANGCGGGAGDDDGDDDDDDDEEEEEEEENDDEDHVWDFRWNYIVKTNALLPRSLWHVKTLLRSTHWQKRQELSERFLKARGVLQEVLWCFCVLIIVAFE